MQFNFSFREEKKSPLNLNRTINRASSRKKRCEPRVGNKLEQRAIIYLVESWGHDEEGGRSLVSSLSRGWWLTAGLNDVVALGLALVQRKVLLAQYRDLEHVAHHLAAGLQLVRVRYWPRHRVVNGYLQRDIGPAARYSR